MNILLKDLYSIKLVDTFDETFKSFDKKKPIYAVISATHTGFVNRNFYRYRKEAAIAGISSFLNPYPKPVLVSHEDNVENVIGRVKDATFVPLANGLLDNNSYNIPDGYVRVVASILDPDAIEKVMDGRLLTVSVGVHGLDVMCSICGQKFSLMSEIMSHEHTLGKYYDGKLCFLDVLELEYEHIAFVNTPADSHAMVEKYLTEEQYNDYIRTSLSDNSKFNESIMLFDMYSTDNEKGGTMGNKPDKKNTKEQEDVIIECEDFSDIELTKEDLDEIDKAQNEIEKEISDFLAKNPDYKDEGVECDDENLEDKKLTTKERKKLRKNVFCGPPRPGHNEKGSFPVPDCLHVRVAKTYLARSNFSADVKKRILACILRREKALGCGESKKDEVENTDNIKVDSSITSASTTNAISDDIIKFVDTRVSTVVSDLNKKIEDHVKSMMEQINEVKSLITKFEKLSTKVDHLQKTIQDFEESKTATNVVVDQLDALVSENKRLNDKLYNTMLKTYLYLDIILNKQQFNSGNLDKYLDEYKTKFVSLADITQALAEKEKLFDEQKSLIFKDSGKIDVFDFFKRK